MPGGARYAPPPRQVEFRSVLGETRRRAATSRSVRKASGRGAGVGGFGEGDCGWRRTIRLIGPTRWSLTRQRDWLQRLGVPSFVPANTFLAVPGTSSLRL